MTINDVIRELTRIEKDILANIEKDIERATQEHAASEQRIKHHSTEITRQKSIEGECKVRLSKAETKVEEVKQQLEELDQKRQETINNLVKYQEEHKNTHTSFVEAQKSTETALTEIKKEQKQGHDLETKMNGLRTQKEVAGNKLQQRLLQALENYLKEQSKQCHASFDSNEKKLETKKIIDEYKKARNSDSEIMQLSEQREETQKFLSDATVPAVKELLQQSLKTIEFKLEKRFPGALSCMPNSSITSSEIYDLLFYCNKQGKAVFLFPIPLYVWENILTNDNDRATRAMCIIWNFLQKLNLKKNDGNFFISHGWPAFESVLDIEDVVVLLQGFQVEYKNSAALSFRMQPAPPELQEAINND